MLKTIISFIFCFSLFFACQNKTKKIRLLDSNGFVETKLGNSGYLVKHPNTMQLDISELQYAKDYPTFLFCKQDGSLIPYSNAFAIGFEVPDSNHSLGFDLPVFEKVRSEVLGTVIDWNIRKNDTGHTYFVADARLRDMKFVATAVTQTGIDSMISLVSTLSSR